MGLFKEEKNAKPQQNKETGRKSGDHDVKYLRL